jgi:glutamate synthase (NADPH/NADH) large chain
MVNNGPFHKFATTPKNQGLYDAAQERDACGLAMVATLRGYAGHDVVDMALSSLRNLEHRGAVGSDAGTGDGAGILTQMPDGFFRAVVDFDLPASGTYGVGLVFMDAKTATKDKARFQAICDEESLTVLGWRTPPTDSSVLGDLAKKAMPLNEQVFV